MRTDAEIGRLLPTEMGIRVFGYQIPQWVAIMMTYRTELVGKGGGGQPTLDALLSNNQEDDALLAGWGKNTVLPKEDQKTKGNVIRKRNRNGSSLGTFRLHPEGVLRTSVAIPGLRLLSSAGGVGLIPGQGAQIPQALQPPNQNRNNTVIYSIKTLKMAHIQRIKKSNSPWLLV